MMDHRPTPQGDATMTPAQLTAWMDSLRLNTVKASQALGISRTTLSGYLAGKYPIPRVVGLACAALALNPKAIKGK